MKVKSIIGASGFCAVLFLMSSCGQVGREAIDQVNSSTQNLTSTTIVKPTSTAAKTTTTSASSATSSTSAYITTTSTSKPTTTTIHPAPSVPAGLGAAQIDGGIKLDWTANNDIDLAGYKIYRMRTDENQFTFIATIEGATSYCDYGTEANQTYYYAVAAIDHSGCESAKSAWAVIKYVVLDKTPPAVPSGLSATSGITTVYLNWQANNEPDLGGYNLYRRTSLEADYHKINTGLIAANTYNDTGLASSSDYYYKVTAVDKSDNESDFSNAFFITTKAAPDTTPPGVPSGITAAPGDFQVQLNWTANTESDLAHYRIYKYCKDGSGNQIGFDYGTDHYWEYFSYTIDTNNYYLDDEVYNGTTYYYRIAAVDAFGNESEKAAEVSATPVSAIDDKAGIQAQLDIYADGMRSNDVAKVMSVISGNYADVYTSMGTTYTTYRSDYQANLENNIANFQMKTYSLTVKNISIIGKTAAVSAEIFQNYGGISQTFKNWYISGRMNKTFTLAREGLTWRITRDKADKYAALESVPSSFKPGFNIMLVGAVCLYDNYGQLTLYLKSIAMNDPSGNPIPFSPGSVGLVGYATIEAGSYSADVTLTDKADATYNFIHSYSVVSGVSASSIGGVAPDQTDHKIAKILEGDF